eukprot:CAMPEP_0170505758 /NCGR_PEP_ID=MMETSP0208-20121228/52147_1 /TAXON_ID=197538 /ORGANISM="Strombidium inclinatum, Strain S3" /LENGTH=34 /DNA_ID= /DNA_START= /DNA_END= /DNA_ORIENTATION=
MKGQPVRGLNTNSSEVLFSGEYWKLTSVSMEDYS